MLKVLEDIFADAISATIEIAKTLFAAVFVVGWSICVAVAIFLVSMLVMYGLGVVGHG